MTKLRNNVRIRLAKQMCFQSFTKSEKQLSNATHQSQLIQYIGQKISNPMIYIYGGTFNIPRSTFY